jgi:hypothetical protein
MITDNGEPSLEGLSVNAPFRHYLTVGVRGVQGPTRNLEVRNLV